jgi:uncharacterized membrane protein
MTEFFYFLGRFHVLLLHLPIGILLLAVLLEIASRRTRFAHFAPSVPAIWLLGAASAIVTAVLGYLHAREGGFDGAAVEAHRIAGTSLAILATGTWLVRVKHGALYDRAWPVFSLVVVALLVLTGHFGGNLTHGNTYLAQYAPPPLRNLIGTPDLTRPKPANLAAADVYVDVVAPALQQRCGSCHNDSKKKGGFSVAGYDKLMKGGEHGPVIAAGKAESSELIRRISLPPDDEDFMPQDGKTPLSAEQTASIRWWVASGAPRTGSVTALNPPIEIREQLVAALGLSPAGTSPAQLAAPSADVPPPDNAVLDALESKGFVVRAIAAGSPLVQVDYTASRRISDSDVAELAKIGSQVDTLNLRSAGLTDGQLAKLSPFRNLVRLRLELNPITDAGLEHLKTLPKLAYLNLYGTKIGDAGLASLGAIPSLREVFLWQTEVSRVALMRFRDAHEGLRIDAGFDRKSL